MRFLPFERTVLKKIGFKKNWLNQTRIWMAIGAFLLISAAIKYFVENEENSRLKGLPDIVIASGAIVLAYGQWIETKHEASIDKYYERLSLTNEGFYRWEEARRMFPFFWEGDNHTSFEKRMYVYLELDNLEYAITKYKYGSMKDEVAFRSLVTFVSRCQSEEFRDLADKCIKNSIGYSFETKEVVNKIANPATISDPSVQTWLHQQIETQARKEDHYERQSMTIFAIRDVDLLE